MELLVTFTPMDAIRNLTYPEQSKIFFFTFDLYFSPRYVSAFVIRSILFTSVSDKPDWALTSPTDIKKTEKTNPRINRNEIVLKIKNSN